MKIDFYLFFDGCCEEVIEFYKQVFGVKLEFVMCYVESFELLLFGMLLLGLVQKIMYVLVYIGGVLVMMFDGMCGGDIVFKGFLLLLDCFDFDQVCEVFVVLVDGGQVIMFLGKIFWVFLFGMVIDCFGVGWMVGVLVDVE